MATPQEDLKEVRNVNNLIEVRNHWVDQHYWEELNPVSFAVGHLLISRTWQLEMKLTLERYWDREVLRRNIL